MELKEKHYREFLIKIMRSNGVEKIQFPNATFQPYKYYIGRGNNSGIVRTALKSRFWWSMATLMSGMAITLYGRSGSLTKF